MEKAFAVATPKGYADTTIRNIWTADRTQKVGIIGTVGDLLKVNLFEYCTADEDCWAFIPYVGNPQTESKICQQKADIYSYIKARYC